MRSFHTVIHWNEEEGVHQKVAAETARGEGHQMEEVMMMGTVEEVD
jgi:hypothetical protein